MAAEAKQWELDLDQERELLVGIALIIGIFTGIAAAGAVTGAETDAAGAEGGGSVETEFVSLIANLGEE